MLGVRALRDLRTTERDAWVARWAKILPAGSRVLDVGAGPCRYRPLFTHCDYRTQDFCAHEPSPGEDWRYGAIDYVSDAAAIPVLDASFDAVLCAEVLEHVPDPGAVVREIGRILRPGGLALITAPLACGLHQEPDHYWGGFTPYWYERNLRAAGFSAIDVQPNGGLAAHFAQESQRFSAMIDPRRVPRRTLPWVLPFWAATVLYHRLLLPWFCLAADRLDPDPRMFTVGYHVSAVKA